jgi:hypothetical protein
MIKYDYYFQKIMANLVFKRFENWLKKMVFALPRRHL